MQNRPASTPCTWRVLSAYLKLSCPGLRSQSLGKAGAGTPPGALACRLGPACSTPCPGRLPCKVPRTYIWMTGDGGVRDRYHHPLPLILRMRVCLCELIPWGDTPAPHLQVRPATAPTYLPGALGRVIIRLPPPPGLWVHSCSSKLITPRRPDYLLSCFSSQLKWGWEEGHAPLW